MLASPLENITIERRASAHPAYPHPTLCLLAISSPPVVRAPPVFRHALVSLRFLPVFISCRYRMLTLSATPYQRRERPCVLLWL